MKTHLTVWVILSFSCPALAAAQYSASLTLTSDYVWRGVSQTLGDPAVQGSFDYEHNSGLYAGVWASNVDFFDPSAPGASVADDDNADLELDLWLGYAGETRGGIGWDVGVMGYFFPGARAELLEDSEEVYAGISYSFLSVQVFRDFDNKTTYIAAGVEWEATDTISLKARVGSFDLQQGDDYRNYQIGMATELAGFGLELSYSDTDLSALQCENFSGYRDLCDGRVVLSVHRDL